MLRRQGRLAVTDRQTLAQYLADWLKRRKLEKTVRDNTWDSYRARLQHIVDHIGTIQLARLRPMHIQRCYGELLERGLSPTSVHYAHRVLFMALKDAVRLEILTKSPADAVTPPRPQSKRQAPFSADELVCLARATEGTRWHALWLLLAAQGLRIGEALALSWADYDPGTLTLRVERTAIAVLGGVGMQLGPLKTEESRRTIELTRRVADALAKHRAIILAERVAAATWEDHNLIFPGTHGQLMRPGVARDALTRELARAGLVHRTPHALRHTMATRLLEGGTPANVVQEALGHADVRTTLRIYAHVTRGMRRAASDLMDRLLDAAERGPEDEAAKG